MDQNKAKEIDHKQNKEIILNSENFPFTKAFANALPNVECRFMFNVTGLHKNDLSKPIDRSQFLSTENPKQAVAKSRESNEVNSIIFHTTSYTLDKAIQTYHDYGTSAHFIIDTDGTIICLIPLELTAFHAGVSESGLIPKGSNPRGFNDVSIGIEILNPHYQDFSKEQLQSFENLTAELLKIIPSIEFTASHRNIAISRKDDPGLEPTISIIEILDKFQNIKTLPLKVKNKESEKLIFRYFNNEHSYKTIVMNSANYKVMFAVF